MFAIVPIIILAGGLSVGAFDDSNLDNSTAEMTYEKSELTLTIQEVAALEAFPLD
ncbi:MAG: hypothetical protein QM479_04885 [Pseudomonadota bacterium]